jgi:hypothetical protein
VKDDDRADRRAHVSNEESFAATLVPRRPRLLLLFSDQEAAAPFRSPRTWSAAAIRQAGIEVMVVTLPEQERAKIRDAQRRQYR